MKEKVIETYNMANHDTLYIITFGYIMFRACIVRCNICQYRTPMYTDTISAHDDAYNYMTESREKTRKFNENS